MTELTRQTLRIALALALMALVGWLDYRTGYEISIYALYTFPIAWIVWTTNIAWGLVLSVVAAAEWMWADLADGHIYNHAWIIWERAVMNLVVFAFVAFSFHRFKHDLAVKNRKLKQFEGVLPVCIACNRIQDAQGHWSELDTFLREHSGAQAEPRLCPDCAGARNR